MKFKRTYIIDVEYEGKTDFGIEFMDRCIRMTVNALDNWRKRYKAQIKGVASNDNTNHV